MMFEAFGWARSLAGIASCEKFNRVEDGKSAVLSRNDVLNVVPEITMILPDETVFTTVLRTRSRVSGLITKEGGRSACDGLFA